MKKILCLLIICLLVYTIYYFNHTDKITYISIGDSLSVGIDSNGNTNYGYSNYLSNYLKDKDLLKSYNNYFSTSGTRIVDLENKLETNWTIKKDGKYFGYKVAFLDSIPSGNDVKNERYSLRDRKILGSVYIYNLERNSNNSYINGRYYDFSIGKTFHSKSRLDCDRLIFIISVDNIGMLGSKQIYQYLDEDDVKFYIKEEIQPDFSGIDN